MLEIRCDSLGARDSLRKKDLQPETKQSTNLSELNKQKSIMLREYNPERNNPL
jgi:hypothetical protein